MSQVVCPTLQSILRSEDCLENVAGLGDYAYCFIKGELASPLARTDNEYTFPQNAFKAGKGLYKFELKDQSQKITGESLGYRRGFKLTFDFVFESVSKAFAKTSRALNNLDVCFIVPDGTDWQILYDPTHKVRFDSGGITSDTGAAAADDRQTTCQAILEPVFFANLYVTPPEGGFEAQLADDAGSSD